MNIKLFVTDFDGVMTNCMYYFNENFDKIKNYNMKDGLAIKNFKNDNIKTMILSGDESNITKAIGERLQFDYIVTGCKNKLQHLQNFIDKEKYSFDEVCFIGDDLNDIELLKKVGLKFAPNNCNKQLKLIKNINILESNGGDGCLSEMYNLFRTFKKKVCFIPSRFQSSRLPGKPLLKIANKTIINRVYDQVKKCKLIDDIIVLTDDDRIKEEVEKFGGNVAMVTEECLNGTERIVKYIKNNYDCCDLVINVQGDEPYINPENIDMCIQNFIDKKYLIPDMKCSTLHFKYDKKDEVIKRSNSKIVLDKYDNILYCSRNIIPGLKKNYYNDNTLYYGHIGVFVFDKEYLLNEYLNKNTKYQLYEDIEWLKILEDGYKINSVLVENNHEFGVDTNEDYIYLCEKYQKAICYDKILFLQNDSYEINLHYNPNINYELNVNLINLLNNLSKLDINLIISIIPDKSKVLNNIISKNLNRDLNNKNYKFSMKFNNIIDHFNSLNNKLEYINPTDTHYNDLAYYHMYCEIQRYLKLQYIDFDKNNIKYLDDPKNGDLIQELNNSTYTKNDIIDMKLPYLDEKYFLIQDKSIELYKYEETNNKVVKLEDKIKFTKTTFGNFWADKYWDVLIKTTNNKGNLVDKSIFIICDSHMRFQQKYFNNTYKTIYIYRNKHSNNIMNIINLIKPDIVLYSRMERFLY